MAARDSTDRTSTKWVDLLVERGHLRLFERRGQAFCGAEGAWAHMTRRRTFKTSFLSLYFLEVGKLFRRFVCVPLPAPPAPGLCTSCTYHFHHPYYSFRNRASFLCICRVDLTFCTPQTSSSPRVVSLLCTSSTLLRCCI